MLSRLTMEIKPNQKESLITEKMCSDWYCYSKDEMTYESHFLSFQQLDNIQKQKADKCLMKILQTDNLPYHLHFYHGGGGE